MTRTAVAGYDRLEEKLVEKEILTPEGVPLTFVVATVGERIWGYFIDMCLLLVALTAVSVPLLFLAALGQSGVMVALWFVAFFLLRNFYFTYFEIRGQGTTPGKRRAGTRVIDRRGRPLRSGAVFVRNLTRELEVFFPLVALSFPDQVIGAKGSLVQLVAGAWFVGMALMPLFNRDRLRVGDLIAGTVVVRSPRAVLYRDLVTERPVKEEPVYRFTPEQLNVYGIYELQVLEDVLRRRGRVADGPKRLVAAKIIAKIGWAGDADAIDVARFLSDFYAAQRARLERGLLFGDRRERKQMPRGKRRE
ncbi:MAG: RDD family protein [Planctomycetota bacterium]